MFHPVKFAPYKYTDQDAYKAPEVVNTESVCVDVIMKLAEMNSVYLLTPFGEFLIDPLANTLPSDNDFYAVHYLGRGVYQVQMIPQ